MCIRCVSWVSMFTWVYDCKRLQHGADMLTWLCRKCSLHTNIYIYMYICICMCMCFWDSKMSSYQCSGKFTIPFWKNIQLMFRCLVPCIRIVLTSLVAFCGILPADHLEALGVFVSHELTGGDGPPHALLAKFKWRDYLDSNKLWEKH